MENLTIQDQPPPGRSSSQTPGNNAFPNHQGPPAGGIPELPPQMFTTAAQLLDLTDKKLLLVLRDGRKLIGVLRSWDQFANLVLQDTVERIFVKDLYADVHRGIFLVRGENVLLLGEIDLDKDDKTPQGYTQSTPEEVKALVRQQVAERKKGEKVRQQKLGALGFEAEHSGEVLF